MQFKFFSIFVSCNVYYLQVSAWRMIVRWRCMIPTVMCGLVCPVFLAETGTVKRTNIFVENLNNQIFFVPPTDKKHHLKLLKKKIYALFDLYDLIFAAN